MILFGRRPLCLLDDNVHVKDKPCSHSAVYRSLNEDGWRVVVTKLPPDILEWDILISHFLFKF